MTTEELKELTKKQIKVMQAFLDGKLIECREKDNKNVEWEECDPLWFWGDFDYRIKPEPTYQPYDVKTLTEAIAKHGYTVKRKNIEEYAIIGHWVEIGFMFIWNETSVPYTRLLTDWVWADDGSPCGVLTDNNE